MAPPKHGRQRKKGSSGNSYGGLLVFDHVFVIYPGFLYAPNRVKMFGSVGYIPINTPSDIIDLLRACHKQISASALG